jgi:hypothetical protein
MISIPIVLDIWPHTGLDVWIATYVGSEKNRNECKRFDRNSRITMMSDGKRRY